MKRQIRATPHDPSLPSPCPYLHLEQFNFHGLSQNIIKVRCSIAESANSDTLYAEKFNFTPKEPQRKQREKIYRKPIFIRDGTGLMYNHLILPPCQCRFALCTIFSSAFGSLELNHSMLWGFQHFPQEIIPQSNRLLY